MIACTISEGRRLSKYVKQLLNQDIEWRDGRMVLKRAAEPPEEALKVLMQWDASGGGS